MIQYNIYSIYNIYRHLLRPHLLLHLLHHLRLLHRLFPIPRAVGNPNKPHKHEAAKQDVPEHNLRCVHLRVLLCVPIHVFLRLIREHGQARHRLQGA